MFHYEGHRFCYDNSKRPWAFLWFCLICHSMSTIISDPSPIRFYLWIVTMVMETFIYTTLIYLTTFCHIQLESHKVTAITARWQLTYSASVLDTDWVICSNVTLNCFLSFQRCQLEYHQRQLQRLNKDSSQPPTAFIVWKYSVPAWLIYKCSWFIALLATVEVSEESEIPLYSDFDTLTYIRRSLDC